MCSWCCEHMNQYTAVCAVNILPWICINVFNIATSSHPYPFTQKIHRHLTGLLLNMILMHKLWAHSATLWHLTGGALQGCVREETFRVEVSQGIQHLLRASKHQEQMLIVSLTTSNTCLNYYWTACRLQRRHCWCFSMMKCSVLGKAYQIRGM